MCSAFGHCPVNINILAPKIGALEINPPPQMLIFLKIALTILIKFQKLMETTAPNKTAHMVSS
jgi:hypothetical protein